MRTQQRVRLEPVPYQSVVGQDRVGLAMSPVVGEWQSVGWEQTEPE